MFLFFNSSISQNWEWGKAIGDLNYSNFNGFGITKICSDTTGNSYIAGAFEDSIVINSFKLIKSVDSTIYMAKLDTAGQAIWCKKQCGLSVSAMAIDKLSNIFIAGQNDGSNSLSKYDSSGILQWCKNTSGLINFVQADDDGNIYIKGWFTDTLNLGAYILISASTSSTFFAKCNSSGSFVWAKKFHSDYSIDYYSGHKIGTVLSNDKIFVMKKDTLIKIDTSGNILSKYAVIAGTDIKGTCLNVDLAGNIYAGFEFQGSINAGIYSFNDVNPCGPFSGGCGDILFCKIDPGGLILWAEHIYSYDGDYMSGIFPGSGGVVTVVGYCGSTLNLEGQYYTPGVFIVKYGVSGLVNTVVAKPSFTRIAISSDVSGNNVFISDLINTTPLPPVVFGNDTISNYLGICIAKLSLPDSAATSVDQQESVADRIKIFPNPSLGKFTIVFNDTYRKATEKKHSVAIKNLLGKLIYSSEITGDQTKIDISDQPKGTYFIEIMHDNERAMKKIILQ